MKLTYLFQNVPYQCVSCLGLKVELHPLRFLVFFEIELVEGFSQIFQILRRDLFVIVA